MTIETAVTTNIIATILMVFTYIYIYLQYRHAYLIKWVTAWTLFLGRQILLEKAFIAHELSPLLNIVFLGMSFAFSILLIVGAVEFAGRRLSKWWPSAAIASFTATSVGTLMHLPFGLYGIPGVAFVGSAYIATGLIFWKVDVRGPGKYLTAGAFILLGLHMFDMPLLFDIPWIAPWGFLIDGLFKFLVALGVVFVYFEKARNELEKYYRLLAENATDVIYSYRLTPSHGFEYISPAIQELTGREPAKFKTIRQVLRIIHPEDRQKFKELFKTSGAAGGLATIRVCHKNGDVVWAEQKYSLVTAPDGRAVAVEGIVRDVTARVLLERDVSRLDRLNIVGKMAANLAHEVRNPLTTVRGYIQMIRNKNELPQYRDRFGMLLDELDRTNQILSEYLSLSKNKMVDMRRCNLNAIIMSLYPLIQADAVGSKVEVVLALGEIRELSLDDKEIKQLVLNLARNSIEAMPKGGRLEIQTAAVGEEIVLTIKDQGEGIPASVLHNLGKPFFTTKEHGTGLGLAMCYSIAQRHNATLDIETGPDGTAVHVRFR